MKTIRIILTFSAALMCLTMLTGCKETDENQPPLIRAITQNKPSTVKTLLNHGANANERLTNGATALMVAAAVGNSDIVEMLISHHASLSTHNNDGFTALLAAAAAGNSDIALLLIKHGANPCQKNDDGLLAYQIALKWGNHESAHNLRYTCKLDTGEHA